MARLAERRGVLLLLAVSCLAMQASPLRSAGGLLPHDAYIWQRTWTPALGRAVEASADRVRQWRVLGAEMSGAGELVAFDAVRDALGGSTVPVVLVVRINGQIPRWNQPAIAASVIALLQRWRTVGLPVTGLEIDHDCGTARLAAYADFLQRLQPVRAFGVTLSITSLPSWMASPRLGDVLAQADESILQVHSVANPRDGLFNPRQAAGWVRRWASRSVTPFRVALPTYGSRVTVNRTGGISSVESEVPRYSHLARGHELFVRPREVAAFLEMLRQIAPPRLTGIVWFRVPTPDDRRAWSLSTWHAVMDGGMPPSGLQVFLRDSSVAGTLDLVIANDGLVDEELPALVTVLADRRCETADALAGYSTERVQRGARLRRLAAEPIAAGAQRVIGWVRCATNEGIRAEY